MEYKPKDPFTVAGKLYNPVTKTVKGVEVKEYELVDTIFCSFKTFGGTESTVNEKLVVIDTANIETWYRPDIFSSSQIQFGEKRYEVVGEPENINMKNQYLKFKIRGVKGGA